MRARTFASLRATAVVAAALLVLTSVSTFAARATSAPRPFFGIGVPQQDVSQIPVIARSAGVSPRVFAIFVKYKSAFTVANLQAIEAAHATPFITVEPWTWADTTAGINQPANSLASIYNGNHDADLRAIARVVAQYGQPVYLRFAHEMNGWWLPWAQSVNGNAPGDYVKAWRHVHDLFQLSGATNARWVWSPAMYVPHARSTAISMLYPGDAYVDYTGMSCYGTTGTATDTCGATLSQIEAVSSRPVILSEIGAAGQTKVRWILSLANLLNDHPEIVGFVWFNTAPSTNGATGDYRFDNSPEDLQAFQQMLTMIGLRAPTPSRPPS